MRYLYLTYNVRLSACPQQFESKRTANTIILLLLSNKTKNISYAPCSFVNCCYVSLTCFLLATYLSEPEKNSENGNPPNKNFGQPKITSGVSGENRRSPGEQLCGVRNHWRRRPVKELYLKTL